MRIEVICFILRVSNSFWFSYNFIGVHYSIRIKLILHHFHDVKRRRGFNLRQVWSKLNANSQFSLDAALRIDNVLEHKGINNMMHFILDFWLVPSFSNYSNVLVTITKLAVTANYYSTFFFVAELLDCVDKRSNTFQHLLEVVGVQRYVIF